MLNIIEYLRDYADQYHHPREDAVFSRLLHYLPDRQLPLAAKTLSAMIGARRRP